MVDVADDGQFRNRQSVMMIRNAMVVDSEDDRESERYRKNWDADTRLIGALNHITSTMRCCAGDCRRAVQGQGVVMLGQCMQSEPMWTLTRSVHRHTLQMAVFRIDSCGSWWCLCLELAVTYFLMCTRWSGMWNPIPVSSRCLRWMASEVVVLGTQLT